MDTKTHPLTKYRADTGLTLEAVADAVGTRKATVWKWENRVMKPRPERIRKIAEFTKGAVSFTDWFEDRD